MSKTKDDEDKKLVFTPEETRKLLGVSRAVIYSLLARNLIPNFKIGRKYFIPKHRFIAWLSECILSAHSPDGDK